MALHPQLVTHHVVLEMVGLGWQGLIVGVVVTAGRIRLVGGIGQALRELIFDGVSPVGGFCPHVGGIRWFDGRFLACWHLHILILKVAFFFFIGGLLHVIFG